MEKRGCAKAALVGMLGGLVGVTSAAFVTWGVLALSLDGPGRWAGALFALISLPLFIAGWRLSHRRRWIARGALLALWCGVLAWWLSLEPRNDRDWLPEVSHLPSAGIEGNRLTFSNVRVFEYRSETDFTPSWEERAYDLDRVRGVDLFLSDWGAAGIVHTILSWEFEGGEHLAVSIETRKEQGEGYSALRGFFRQFELYYVVADERDVIGLRARFRGDRLRLYRLVVSPERARDMLIAYARRIDRLLSDPAWYNAVNANCTTTIRLHALELGLEQPWDWRILANKRIDELLYERGQVNTSLPFAELRARSDVTQAAIDAYGQPDFSAIIRKALPPRPVGRP